MEELKLDIVRYIRTRGTLGEEAGKHKLHHLMRGMLYDRFKNIIGDLNESETHKMLLNESLLDEILSGQMDARYLRHINLDYVITLRVGGLKLKDKYSPCLYKLIKILYTQELSPLNVKQDPKTVVKLFKWLDDQYRFLHVRHSLVNEQRKVEAHLLGNKTWGQYDWIYKKMTPTQLKAVYQTYYNVQGLQRVVANYKQGGDNRHEVFYHLHARHWYEQKTQHKPLTYHAIINQGLHYDEPYLIGSHIKISSVADDIQNGLTHTAIIDKHKLTNRQLQEVASFVGLAGFTESLVA